MSSEITLPTEPVSVENKNPKTMLIYAPPKVGKTTIMAGLEDNLLLDLEKGASFVEAMKMNVKNIKHLQKIGEAVVKSDKKYKYVTVDTITELEEWAEKNKRAKYKRTPQGKDWNGSSLRELDYGLGYGLWRDEFKLWLNKLSKISDHTIFIGHVKDKIVDKEGTEVSVKDLNLTGQIKAIATSYVDAVGYLYIDPEDQNKRRITFVTQDELTCGNRCKHLEGKDFVISEKTESGEIITHWDEVFID